jgi:hypothetical protein
MAATVLGFCSLPFQAMANPQDLQTTPLTMADALAVERHSQDSLDRLAGQLGNRLGQSSNSALPDLAEQLPFIDDLIGNFVDESGDVRLPMGLTVYDAMGTTSVGFGGTF